MEKQPDIPFRIEVTLGGDADITVVEEEFTWGENSECEFVLYSPDGDETIFYGDLETSIDAMEYLEELGYVLDAI